MLFNKIKCWRSDEDEDEEIKDEEPQDINYEDGDDKDEDSKDQEPADMKLPASLPEQDPLEPLVLLQENL